MTVAKPLQRGLIDRATKLALQLGREQAAAHADLTVDPPHGQIEPLLAQGDVPGSHVIVDAVDQRSVEIEEECRRAAHHHRAIRAAADGFQPSRCWLFT